MTVPRYGFMSQAMGSHMGASEGWHQHERPALRGVAHYALKSALAPDVPPNAGLYRAIKVITAPPGTLVNAVELAATLNCSDTEPRAIDVIIGALSQAAPEKVIAACKRATTGIGFHGWRGEHRKYWFYLETIGGGVRCQARSRWGGRRPEGETNGAARPSC